MNEFGFHQESSKPFQIIESKEAESGGAGIIVVGGMMDLPYPILSLIKITLKAKTFESKWLDKDSNEDMETKLLRLDKQVRELKNQGKQVILIGVSAGAALSMAYLLRHPDDICHIYALSGLLNPDLNDANMSKQLKDLTKDSHSFEQVAQYLTKELNPQIITQLNIANKISVYSSNADTVVPLMASEPEWVRSENRRRVSSFDHVTNIGITLIRDIHRQLRQLKGLQID